MSQTRLQRLSSTCLSKLLLGRCQGGGGVLQLGLGLLQGVGGAVQGGRQLARLRLMMLQPRQLPPLGLQLP